MSKNSTTDNPEDIIQKHHDAINLQDKIEYLNNQNEFLKSKLKKLTEKSRGKPPLGDGVKPPAGGNAKGKPPLGHGVKLRKK